MKTVVEKRDIRYLMHFTQLENLDSILKNGLLPRSKLEEENIIYTFNDVDRLDAHLDSISCSISFPNYKMFYRLRKTYSDSSWIIILINTSVLWEKKCAFYHVNAARNDVRSIDPDKIGGEDALESVFNEYNDWLAIADKRLHKLITIICGKAKPIRENLGIPDRFPTDPQAEVLVFDEVEPKYIEAVLTQSITPTNELERLYPDTLFKPNKSFFTYRSDWAFWKKDEYGY